MDDSTLTPAQRAGRTNHERAVARRERMRAEQRERELLRSNLTAILESNNATDAERLRAAELLMIANGIKVPETATNGGGGFAKKPGLS